MDSAILEKVRELREQGHSPKQIARALGMAPSAVAPLVRAVAEQARATPRRRSSRAAGSIGSTVRCAWPTAPR